jgi:hypothetical protein
LNGKGRFRRGIPRTPTTTEKEWAIGERGAANARETGYTGGNVRRRFYMITRNDITEAVSLDLLKKGYSIAERPKGRHKGADIIARDPETKARLFVSAAGRTRSEIAADKPRTAHTESEVLHCMVKSIHSALRTRKEDKFSRDDKIALAFPDAPECLRYLDAEKPVLDSLGVKIILVNEKKEVREL